MRSELKRALGAALKSYRLNKNITQEEMGPSQTHISNLERGKWSPSIDKIEQMSNLLGVHPASVILAAYISSEEGMRSGDLLRRIQQELQDIGL